LKAASKPHPNNRQQPDNEATSSSEAKTYFCYACGGKGHIAKYCKKVANEREKPVRKSNETFQQKSSQVSDTQRSASIATREYKALCAQKRNTESREGIWLSDGGASDTMTSRRKLFREFLPMTGEVTVGDGTPLKIEGKGKVLLHVSDECGGFDLQFSDVLYVPKLQDNLISQDTLDRKGMTIMTANGR